ncbi:hypothetical protein Q7P37_008385 [Cladosporium fusiforme]
MQTATHLLPPPLPPRTTLPSPSSPPLHQRPPHRKSLSNFSSALSYFTEPVSYTFAGVARRISADDAPTPLARALSANYNGSMDSVFNPPIRRHSPFQPPPLTPLSLSGYKDSTPAKARLLSKAVAEEIRLLLPPRLQLADNWQLAYSLEQDGSTLSTLYSHAARYRGKRAGFVLVIRDSTNGIFGAYLSDPPRPHASYYGSGECFLWRALRLPALPDLSSLPPPPSADTTNLQRMTTVGVAKKLHSSNGNGNNHNHNSSSTSLSSLNVPSANGNGRTTPLRNLHARTNPLQSLPLQRRERLHHLLPGRLPEHRRRRRPLRSLAGCESEQGSQRHLPDVWQRAAERRRQEIRRLGRRVVACWVLRGFGL